jgi:hypothetical protein
VTVSNKSKLSMACALFAGLLSCPLQSSAETAAGPGTPRLEPEELVTFGAGILDPGALDRYRGGTDVVIENTNATDGAVHGNDARNLVTGTNVIDGGSFAGASGISTVVQNSGNNVLIQSPIIVNLQVE